LNVLQESKARILDEVLAKRLPESRSWPRCHLPMGQVLKDEQRSTWIEIPSPVRPDEQRLCIHLRHDGDIQVEYYLEGKQFPREWLFILPEGEERGAIESVVQFVEDILNERLVLAKRRGFWKCADYLSADQVERDRGKWVWVTSWQGTYDWKR
jgi:hypothetical protein